MNNSLVVAQTKLDAIEKLLAQGDLTPMTQPQRLDYMRSMCKLLGISMLGQPFDFIKNPKTGTLGMYANSKAAAQLRGVYKISLRIASTERIQDLFICTIEAETAKGRKDADIGAISLKGLSGTDAANATMKALTKGKRRATLSLCGLGSLDADTMKELSDAESKRSAERAVEQTSAKLEQTLSRPEFETELPTPSMEPEVPPNDATSQEYTLKSMKGAKGKRLSHVPLKNLVKFIKYFDEAVEKGTPMHPDVQDDAFHIRPFLEEAAVAVPNE